MKWRNTKGEAKGCFCRSEGRVINSPAKSFNLNSSKMKNSSDGPVVGHEVEPRSNSSNSTNQLLCDEPARAAELELNSRQADATDSRPKSAKSSAHRLCHSVDSPQKRKHFTNSSVADTSSDVIPVHRPVLVRICWIQRVARVNSKAAAVFPKFSTEKQVKAEMNEILLM